MLKVKGYPTSEQIKSKFPEPEYLVKPKAIIECYQEIPCNPCSESCPVGAITIGEDINQIPILDVNKCIGCGKCIYSCPGLAIMVVKTEANRAIFKIPYELLPVPKPKTKVLGVNRHGEVICDAIVEAVMSNKDSDRTVVLTVSVPKEYLYEFVTIRCRL